jgi:hypothetical protein
MHGRYRDATINKVSANRFKVFSNEVEQLSSVVNALIQRLPPFHHRLTQQ